MGAYMICPLNLLCTGLVPLTLMLLLMRRRMLVLQYLFLVSIGKFGAYTYF